MSDYERLVTIFRSMSKLSLMHLYGSMVGVGDEQSQTADAAMTVLYERNAGDFVAQFHD